MFKVKKFDVCRATGITSFELEWDMHDGHGLQEDKRTYLLRSDAEKYILSCKRTYILLLFEKYVKHAQVLFETSKQDFYHTQSKIESLDHMLKYLDWFQDKNLEGVCRVLVHPDIEADLRKILLSPSNPSFDSSESRILDMLVFSKKELENYPSQPLKRIRHEERV